MKALPLYVDGEMSFAELNNIFRAAGYHLRMVGGQIVVTRVPAFLRREEPASNVVQLGAHVRGVKR